MTGAASCAPHAKLLFVLPSLNLAGAQTVVAELARRLDRERYDLAVCCLLGLGSFETELRKLGVDLHRLAPAGFKDIRLPTRVARLIRRERVALVASHFHPFDLWVAAGARAAGVPCVVTKHSTYMNDPLPRPLRRAIERATQRLAGGYVAVSRAVADHMVADRGVDPERVQLIYNGVDVRRFAADAAARASVRAELRLGEDDVAIGTVANLHRVTKGYEVLLEAVPEVVASFPKTRFVWVGRDTYGLGAELTRRAGVLGVSQHLTLTGPRDDVPRLLAAMDFFVLPSTSEGLGIALIEAMACGLPVVASDVGGIPEVVADGETGLLARVGDAGSFASALRRMQSDRAHAAAMGEAGRVRAHDRFAVTAMVAAYRDVFERLLDRV